MLCLSRKTDYALIALGYLAERAGQIVSARDVAIAYRLPQALLMNILKTLQKHRILSSTRGYQGGYRISADLTKVSLDELIRILEGSAETAEADTGGLSASASFTARRRLSQAPIQALHYKLKQFLHDVSLADLIVPGRRIDVPAEALRGKRNHTGTALSRQPSESLIPVEV